VIRFIPFFIWGREGEGRGVVLVLRSVIMLGEKVTRRTIFPRRKKSTNTTEEITIDE